MGPGVVPGLDQVLADAFAILIGVFGVGFLGGFLLTLLPAEAAELQVPVGSGGHQTLHQMLLDQLANGNLTITLTDAQLGRLVRYMGYGSGGFQSRLRRAFRRPIGDLINS